jgi:hypothetical protein
MLCNAKQEGLVTKLMYCGSPFVSIRWIDAAIDASCLMADVVTEQCNKPVTREIRIAYNSIGMPQARLQKHTIS